jgi:hypothetical protein
MGGAVTGGAFGAVATAAGAVVGVAWATAPGRPTLCQTAYDPMATIARTTSTKAASRPAAGRSEDWAGWNAVVGSGSERRGGAGIGTPRGGEGVVGPGVDGRDGVVGRGVDDGVLDRGSDAAGGTIGLGAAMVGASARPVPRPVPAMAATKLVASGKRSAGALDNWRSSACSIDSGTSGLRMRAGGGGVWTWA